MDAISLRLPGNLARPESRRQYRMTPLPSIEYALRILIVEDESDEARSLAALLSLHGYHPSVARDGPSALDLAERSLPDVALVDIGLPGMDGWEVAKGLRQCSYRRRPLLIAISGYGQPEDFRRSKLEGMDLHLVKPVDLDVLFGILGRFEHFMEPAPGDGPSVEVA
jgi:CheY-like chemotaxis protein